MSVKSSPKKTKEKKKKGKLKSSLSHAVMGVHCSVWGYSGATKMVFNSPNRPGLRRGWDWGSPMLTHAHSVQTRGRHCCVGCPGLGRCSGLHGSAQGSLRDVTVWHVEVPPVPSSSESRKQTPHANTCNVAGFL